MGASAGLTEEETCRAFVVPELKAAGWDKLQIREQYRITNGKMIATARRHRPGNPLVADYVLEYRDDLPLAVVEAKRTRVDAAAGIEQAKRYVRQLALPVAFATNGREVWEIEIGGEIRQRLGFPPSAMSSTSSGRATRSEAGRSISRSISPSIEAMSRRSSASTLVTTSM